MEIKKVILHHFKGVADGEYDFSHRTWIKGQNGSGKSTIATAILWCLTDYDYAMNSNPMVEPLNMAESNPTVTLVCDMDGKEVTITKTQNIRRSNDGDVEKKSANNKYLINEVPITQRDFKAKMLEYRIPIDKVLSFMHPNDLISQKPMDQKKVLFEMTEQHTDYEIARMGDDTQELVPLLKDYSVEEVSAKYKASKKKCDEMTKSIPEQIKGMESSKTSEDPQEYIDRKERLMEEANRLQEEFAKNDKSAELAEIRSQLFAAQRELSEYERKLKDNESLYKRKAAENTLAIKKRIVAQNEVIYTLGRQIKECEFGIREAQDQKTRATKAYRELKAAKPPVFVEPKKLTDADMVCPTCGQALPEKLRQEKISGYKAEYAKAKAQYDRDFKAWNIQHDKDVEEVIALGQTACDNIRICEEKMEKTSVSIDNQKLELDRLEKALNKSMKEEEVPYSMTIAEAQELDKLKERVSYLDKLLKASADISNQADKAAVDAKVDAIMAEVREIDRHLAVIHNNSRIDEKIEQLENDRKKYEQGKADAEMILYELDILSRKKNDLLVAEINSHFSLVKFQLFEYMKNGKYKEVCVPTIDGYRFGESTNTGREIRGKLDICQSLQNFYGVNLPIILDNAESINDYNIPDIDSQLILLAVTDDKKLVVESD